MGIVNLGNLISVFLAPFPGWFQDWFGFTLFLMLLLLALKIVQFVLDLKFW